VFAAGQSIVTRTVVQGRVRFAEPAIAVADEPDQLAFYRAAGTPMKVPASATIPRSDPTRDAASRAEYESGVWDHHDAEWSATNVLVVARPGAWWSGWLFWDAGSAEFLAWYVNYECPWARSRFGFDSKDLSLDLVVTADGTVIEKDRDDYEARILAGLISSDEAREVERADAEARRAIGAGEPPFDDDWIAWRPDPAWPQATLPPDWDVV
jgi:hypothetical protein